MKMSETCPSLALFMGFLTMTLDPSGGKLLLSSQLELKGPESERTNGKLPVLGDVTKIF